MLHMDHAFLIALFQGLQRTLRVKPGMAELKALTAWMGKAEGPSSRDGLERAIGLFLVKDRDDWSVFKAEFDRQYAAYAFTLGENIRAELKLLQQPEPTAKPGDLPEPATLPEQPDTEPEPDPVDLKPAEPAPEYFIEQTIAGGGSELLQRSDAPASFLDYPYLFSEEYLPVTPRQMENEWRFLQRNIRQGENSQEIDIKATVSHFARALAIDGPKWRRLKINKIQLLLLIDRGGSMIAHHALGEQLLRAAIRTKWDRQVKACYFRNLPPGDFTRDQRSLAHLKLYLTAGMVRAITLGEVLRQFNLAETKVLIYSDAGAARGGMNHERVKKTGQWISALRRQVGGVVWLNPMPSERWYGTSADWLREEIAMFEANRQGLHHAIKYLQSA